MEFVPSLTLYLSKAETKSKLNKKKITQVSKSSLSSSNSDYQGKESCPAAERPQTTKF